jgi:phospholipid/cholesterol/gamma-HCH transport system permease protein
MASVSRGLASVGRNVLGFVGSAGSLTLSAFEAMRHVGRSLVPGGRLRLGEVVRQIWLTSSSGLPIAGLIVFMIGLILAFQSSYQLARLGAEKYVASLVAVAITRELGPVITAIVVAGRSGSAIAAEIASMKIQEELDALEVMGFNIMKWLISPRVLALIIGLPLLVALTDIIGILGGLTCSVFALDIPAERFIQTARESLQLKDFVTGLAKAGVFGCVIATVGAWCGLNVSGGPEGVGRATTRAVVLGILLIVVTDTVFTGLFFRF